MNVRSVGPQLKKALVAITGPVLAALGLIGFWLSPISNMLLFVLLAGVGILITGLYSYQTTKGTVFQIQSIGTIVGGALISVVVLILLVIRLPGLWETRPAAVAAFIGCLYVASAVLWLTKKSIKGKRAAKFVEISAGSSLIAAVTMTLLVAIWWCRKVR